MSKIIEYGLVDEYEHFILHRPSDYLHDFLRQCKFSEKDIKAMTLYKTNAGNALVPGKSLSEIHEFIHDKLFRPYIPGSSLKGAFRTAILMKLIRENPRDFTLRPGARSKFVEEAYLHTLNLNKDNNTGKPDDTCHYQLLSSVSWDIQTSNV
jgi:CRISPR-associated protein Csm5